MNCVAVTCFVSDINDNDRANDKEGVNVCQNANRGRVAKVRMWSDTILFSTLNINMLTFNMSNVSVSNVKALVTPTLGVGGREAIATELPPRNILYNFN